jgi:multisubunit Na+/H+ antiporter MnhG subunit
MTPVEIMALVTALLVLGKVITLLRSQRLWFSTITTRFWGGTGTTTLVVSAVVAAATLWFLLEELTIVQVWAAMLFCMAITVMALAPFSAYLLEAEDRWFTETRTIHKGWPAAVVWVVLSLWVLYALLV